MLPERYNWNLKYVHLMARLLHKMLDSFYLLEIFNFLGPPTFIFIRSDPSSSNPPTCYTSQPGVPSICVQVARLSIRLTCTLALGCLFFYKLLLLFNSTELYFNFLKILAVDSQLFTTSWRNHLRIEWNHSFCLKHTNISTWLVYLKDANTFK